ncbi:hypothetical protein AB0F52_46045 [Amycolatopsis sp. NPDC024027]|uniref:hypothetical protein n=1 Tax=Amycolatopsis sp. NPDC024027 TaxID=3154327 RepID=UPI0033DB7B03
MTLPESDRTTHPAADGPPSGKGKPSVSRLDLRLGGSAGNDRDTRQDLLALRKLLRESGVADAELPVVGAPRPNTRGTEDGVADVVANLAPTLGLVGRVISTLRGWLAGRPQRSIDLTIGDASIKITGLSSRNEDLMVEAFVRRVCGGE